MRWLALFGLMIVAMVVAVLVIGLLSILPWWGMIGAWLWIGIIAVWVLTFADIWRRADMSPVSIGIWTLLVLVFPFGGTFIYILTRPSADKIRYKGDPPID